MGSARGMSDLRVATCSNEKQQLNMCHVQKLCGHQQSPWLWGFNASGHGYLNRIPFSKPLKYHLYKPEVKEVLTMATA